MSELAAVAAADWPRRTSTARSAEARCQRQPSVGGGHGESLDASIRRISTVFSAPSNEHWAIRTPGMRRVANVDLSAEWLSINLSLRLLRLPISLKIIGSTLSRNAGLNGCCRIIGQRQQGRRQVVADIPVDLLPWDCETDLDALIGSTIADLNAALSTNAQHSESLSQAGLPREQIETLFNEAGWPAQPGEGENLEVPLEVPGSYLVANVSHDSNSTRLRVPILAGKLAAAPHECRDAVTVLLWLTSSRIRMVKATRSRRALALDVSLPAVQVNAIGLAHACAALSAALQQFVAEAGLLIADEDLARIYLSTLEFPPSA